MQIKRGKDLVCDLLSALNTFAQVGPDGLYPRVLKGLADVISKTLSKILRTTEVQGKCQNTDEELTFFSSIFKTRRKKQDQLSCHQYIGEF